MFYVLEKTEDKENTTVESVSSKDDASEYITSDDCMFAETISAEEESTSSTASIEEPKEWPKGGSESFTNHALPALALGMLGIFLVLGLISIATMALNKMFPGNKNQ